MQFTRPAKPGRVGKQAFSGVFRGGPTDVSNISERLVTPLPELRFAGSTLPRKLRLGRMKCDTIHPPGEAREGRKTSVQRCFPGRAYRRFEH
ncbi:hypothetical protein EC9_35010 [Rosistilla ulvae]|uniref:Uncharacterized protein n=1 Tax=Rosistilla ulvae TaxID=1930277 RepID=A0A517M361_9BACT|nr:hypothetical protein EC9_35010 [Rosistilla ulvae]